MEYKEAEKLKNKTGDKYKYENELYDIIVAPKDNDEFNDFIKYYRLNKKIDARKYSFKNQFDVYALISKRGSVLGKSISCLD